MGVWIETSWYDRVTFETEVTPCVGVWIETIVPLINSLIFSVTPCVGVWIETFSSFCLIMGDWRHTLRGCVD